MQMLLKGMMGLRTLMVMLAVVQCLACSGGKKKEVTYGSGDGKVTVTQKDGSEEGRVTIRSEQGETVVSTKKASEGDFDVPFYPGATQDDSGSLSVNNRSKMESGQWSMVVLRTKDPFENVVKFYKEKLPGAQAYEASTEDAQTATLVRGKVEDGPITTVMINRNKAEKDTSVNITRGSGK